MPYLDGTPSPGDKIGESVNKSSEAYAIPITEPEEMIATLLQFIYSVNGRKIEAFGVQWVDQLDGQARPIAIKVDSSMSIPLNKG